MNKKVDLVLEKALITIKPEEEEIRNIDKELKNFIKEIKERIKKFNIKTDIFIGGSFAKKTLIKKKKYDVDIFLRFDKKEKNISELTQRILKNFKFIRIHGSRDYFRVPIKESLFFELIPVRKIRTPKESENITDLSCSHVRYINKKIKSKKIRDEILLAKAFCYAKECYGAESYIKGFSGYSLELLISYYGSFLRFLRDLIKIKEKEVIDIEKHYKNKQEVFRDMNTSKLQSPIILIDPTYKQRNALAALSNETFEKFKKNCENFLKNPSLKEFEKEKIDLNKVKDSAKRDNYEFILLDCSTDKQEGDIAGGKLLKFYNFLNREINKFFDIKTKGFLYNEEKNARYYFVVKSKEEIIFEGPYITDEKNLLLFKKKHKNNFIKGDRIYSKEKINWNIKEFIDYLKDNNKKIIQEMKIINLKELN